MVSGDEHDRHSGGRQAFERRERRLRQPGRHAASIEQVAAVNHHVGPAGACGLERSLEVSKEVLAPASPDDAGAAGQVEPEMGVGNEQYAHVRPTRAQSEPGVGQRRRDAQSERHGRAGCNQALELAAQHPQAIEGRKA